MSTSERVVWWEPYRETLKSSRLELRAAGVLSAKFWLRTIGIAFILIVTFVGWILYTYPAAGIPWTNLIAGIVLVPLLIAGSLFANFLLCPIRIELRPTWIQFNRGQSGARVHRDQIDDIVLTTANDGMQSVTLHYHSKQGAPRQRTFALGPAVDRAALSRVIAQLSSADSGDAPW